MSHKEMSESEGDFGPKQSSDRPCRFCGGMSVTMTTWESSDGAYEDEKYTCSKCGKSWWVEGIDS